MVGFVYHCHRNAERVSTSRRLTEAWWMLSCLIKWYGAQEKQTTKIPSLPSLFRDSTAQRRTMHCLFCSLWYQEPANFCLEKVSLQTFLACDTVSLSKPCHCAIRRTSVNNLLLYGHGHNRTKTLLIEVAGCIWPGEWGFLALQLDFHYHPRAIS